MKWWLCEIDSKGKYTLEELDTAPEVEPGASITFQAPTREKAELKAAKLAMNVYARIKKKEAKIRKHSNGQCCCGRKQDRPNPDHPGKMLKTCSVCAHRQTIWTANSKKGLKKPRDEKARIAKNLERQRDRRKELRLETLVEVKNKFWEYKTLREFENWLEAAIEECSKP